MKGCRTTEWEIKTKFSIELTLNEMANRAMKEEFTVTELPNENFMIEMMGGKVELNRVSFYKFLQLIER